MYRGANREDYFSAGLVAFLVVCFVAAVLCFRRRFSNFDELWCWGPMVKESLRLDRFYCVPASRLIIHKDYPPFPAIMELLWTKTANRYSEGVVIMSMVTESLSLVVVPLAEMLDGQEGAGEKGRKRTRLVHRAFSALMLTLLMMLVINAFDSAHVFATIMVDIPLAALFSFGLVLILSGQASASRFGTAMLTLTGVMLVMTKQPGLALLPALWLACLLKDLPPRGRERRKRAVESLWVLVVPLLVFLSWHLYVKSQNIQGLRVSANGGGQFDLAKISVQAYLDALLKRGNALQWQTLWNLNRAFFTVSVSNLAWPPISFATAFCLLLLGILGLNRLCPEDFDDRKARLAGIALCVMTLLFAFMMSVMFVFFFTADEMEDLRGYARYADIYVLSLLLPLASMGILLMKRRGILFHRLRNQLALVLLAAVLLGSTSLIYLTPQVLQTQSYTQYEPLADQILAHTEVDSRITVVYDIKTGRYGKWYGSLQAVVYYYANDRELLGGKDLFAADYDAEGQRAQVLRQLEESDYLFVVNTNEALNEFISPYNGGAGLAPGAIYRIEKDEKGLHLTWVEN